MPTDWILRIGDGKNFQRSARLNIWGFTKNASSWKFFMKNVQKGDRLWFVVSKNNGKAVAVATFNSYNERSINSLTNQELGWEGEEKEKEYWDTELHYFQLYFIEKYNYYTQITGPAPVRKYNNKCKVKLEEEYYLNICEVPEIP